MNLNLVLLVLCLLRRTISIASLENEKTFKIGTGIGDITGPAAELYMQMFGSFTQKTYGIYTRLYSRAFIIEDYQSNRVCHVTIDCGMADMLVKLEVIKKLTSTYNGLYTEKNVMISATHTHASPAGYSQYILYSSPYGFDQQNFDAIVNGIVASIHMAHKSMSPGHIYFNEGKLLGVSINRSPTAYANNPKEERALYEENTDKSMYILKFTHTDGSPMGAICWFAVHPTNLNSSNTLISSDNKGYAAYLLEKYIKEQASVKNQFIAAFPNANTADSSPNTKGPRCINTGAPCNDSTTTCNGDNTKCIAFGPGIDMYESSRIIGTSIFLKAKELFETASDQITGTIKFIHQYVDMSDVTVTLPGGKTVKTCKPAMGYSFAAGTMDGPGLQGYGQGPFKPSFLYILLRYILFPRESMKLNACHKPKQIFMPTGEMYLPYDWTPNIVPTQIFQIGDVFIAAVPAEFSTMSGRRLKRLLQNITKSNKVIFNGYANAYSSYVTTYEEYQIQRYEGGSTLYGPYTLDAYLQQFNKLTTSLMKNEKVASGPDPPNLSDSLLQLHFGVLFDTPMLFRRFGDCTRQPLSSYKIGSVVIASFVSGHPKNNLMSDKTFFAIQRQSRDTKQFKTVKTDADPDTTFKWQRVRVSSSEMTIYWTVANDTKAGIYKIQHFGYHKTPLQRIYPYSGECKQFEIVT